MFTFLFLLLTKSWPKLSHSWVHALNFLVNVSLINNQYSPLLDVNSKFLNSLSAFCCCFVLLFAFVQFWLRVASHTSFCFATTLCCRILQFLPHNQICGSIREFFHEIPSFYSAHSCAIVVVHGNDLITNFQHLGFIGCSSYENTKHVCHHCSTRPDPQSRQ